MFEYGSWWSGGYWFGVCRLSSAVDGCMVGDDSVVICACIILLDGYCLLVDSGSVDYKFINH